MFRIATVWLVGCLASGCFSTPAIYPEHWPQPQVSDDRRCPSIDGRYANAGESVTEARSLAHVLNGGAGVDSLALWNKLGDSFADPALDPNVMVRLSVADGRLHVTAAHADGSSRSMALRVSSSCRNGLLALAGDWDTDVQLISPAAPEISRKSIALGRAADGSLLMRQNKSAAQFFLFTPMFGYSEAAWIRFEEAPAVIAPVAEAAP